VAVNSVVTKPKELESIVIRPGRSPTVYLGERRPGWRMAPTFPAATAWWTASARFTSSSPSGAARPRR